MLSHLTIQGFAIIDHLAIDFSPHFNVITGETGAGKSILIKALTMLMGGKVGADFIRSGRDKASVTGVFTPDQSHKVFQLLEDLGIETGGEIIVRRQVSRKGRAQGWVNDTPVTIAILRDLGYVLLDLFGQHDNQKLLDPAQHLKFVDQFLKKPGVLVDFREAFNNAMSLLTKITTTLETLKERSAAKDYLTFRLNELETFAPDPEDFIRIDKKLRVVEAGLASKGAYEAFASFVNDEFHGGGLGAKLQAFANKLPQSSACRESCEALLPLLDDLSYSIERELSQLDVDDSELSMMQDRLSSYFELFRKHDVSDIDGLMNAWQTLEAQVQFVEDAEKTLDETVGHLVTATASCKKQAELLTKARRSAARKASENVTKEIQELEMEGARIEAQLLPVERSLEMPGTSFLTDEKQRQLQAAIKVLETLNPWGAEKARFLFQPNPGESMQGLSKIASGGEVSRLMLALKRSLAAGADTCVLVFDEIDTGISGRTADVVGQKIKDLSQRFQVVCISHLPQVACYADKHFLVKKSKESGRTESSIDPLDKERRTEEIARLLSGAKITNMSLKNAKSLLARSLH